MFHRLVAHDRKSGLWGVIQGGEGPNTTFQVAHTYACILAPQAVGALLRFTDLHEEDPSLPADDDWVDVGIGAPGWRALAAPQAEPATLRWALDTVVAPHIAAAPPGSQVIYRQDALAVRRLRYVHDAQTLDLMAHSAVAIGTALRGATAAWPRHAFATELPPPFW